MTQPVDDGSQTMPLQRFITNFEIFVGWLYYRISIYWDGGGCGVLIFFDR